MTADVAHVLAVPVCLAAMLLVLLFAIPWAVWFFGPKPRGSFREFVRAYLGSPRQQNEYVLPSATEPILPEDEPERYRITGERRARGSRARIQREEIEGALDRMARRAAKAWSESNPDDTAKREEAYRLVNVIHALRKELRTVEADGEMAAREETLRPADNR